MAVTETLGIEFIDNSSTNEVKIRATASQLRVMAALGRASLEQSRASGVNSFKDDVIEAAKWARFKLKALEAGKSQTGYGEVVASPAHISFLQDGIGIVCDPLGNVPLEGATYNDFFEGLQPVAEGLELAARLQR